MGTSGEPETVYLAGLTFDGMVKHASTALKEGRWVIFAGHEIGKTAFQTTDAAALEQFCRYAKDPANGIWLDTVTAEGRAARSSSALGEWPEGPVRRTAWATGLDLKARARTQSVGLDQRSGPGPLAQA